MVVHRRHERGAVAQGQHLLEREILGQDPRGLDEPLVPRVDHPREDARGGGELGLDVAARAPGDRGVDREQRADLDERDEGQEGDDDAGLEAPEDHDCQPARPADGPPPEAAARAEKASAASIKPAILPSTRAPPRSARAWPCPARS